MIKEKYHTKRLTLIQSTVELSELVTTYCLKNKDFLAEFEPERTNDFFTDKFQKSILQNDENQKNQDLAYKFWIFKNENLNKIIGCISFTNIVRGPFQSCYLGYKLDKDNLNNGYMTEALDKCIEIAFNEINIHRIEANIMPRNKQSIRVVTKLGFKNEGLSQKYLNINGVWEDHVHMVLINDKWKSDF